MRVINVQTHLSITVSRPESAGYFVVLQAGYFQREKEYGKEGEKKTKIRKESANKHIRKKERAKTSQ